LRLVKSRGHFVGDSSGPFRIDLCSDLCSDLCLELGANACLKNFTKRRLTHVKVSVATPQNLRVERLGCGKSGLAPRENSAAQARTPRPESRSCERDHLGAWRSCDAATGADFACDLCRNSHGLQGEAGRASAQKHEFS
jgi:hypothetical protein